MSKAIGWCHVCGRDIAHTSDHVLGCLQSEYGPDHPEIAPTTALVTVVLEVPRKMVEGIDREIAGALGGDFRIIATYEGDAT